ncbi:MAG TPA: alpha/beta fold hydrolase, partial [Nocardioidaceae bacterium]
GGLADLRPMPRTLIDEGVLREVYHYRPVAKTREQGDPVLLVTPLAAPSLCFDLRRGCSLVEHFVTAGRPTYLVEYGQVSFRDRNLGMEHWVDEVIPAAIKEVSEHAGGRPVHVLGWSLGGIFALLTAADRQDLPIASLIVVGSPVDVTKVPLVAPIRPLLNITDGGLVTQLYRAMGGAPKPLVRRAFQLSSFNKLVTKPLAIAAKLDDTDFLAQIEAVDRFTANMTAYPGRTFGQIYHRLLKGNQLATGMVKMDGTREVALADIRVPMLVFAGASDGIAPVRSIQPMVDLVPNAPSVRFEVVPGGHLGMLTGRAARDTTWRIVDEFIDEHATPTPVAPGRKAAAKKPAKKAAARKSGGDSTPARKRTAKKSAPRPDAIGSNPARRYGSASSRSLAAGS